MTEYRNMKKLRNKLASMEPCYICGEPAAVILYEDDDFQIIGYHAQCEHKHISINFLYKTRDEAISKWNALCRYMKRLK